MRRSDSMSHMSTCRTNTSHCESCGSTDYEDIAGGSPSKCCNELVSLDAHDCRDHHGRNARFQADVDAMVIAAGYDPDDQNAMIDAVGLAAWDAALAPIKSAHGYH